MNGAARLVISVIDPDRPEAPPREVCGRTLTNSPADAPAMAALGQLASMAGEIGNYLEVIDAAAEARDAVIASLAAGELIARAKRMQRVDIALLTALAKTSTKATQ